MDDIEQQPVGQEATEQVPVLRGKIKNIGCLDLRGIRRAEDLSRIEAIINVGVILVQEDQLAVIGTVPMTNVGGVVPIPNVPNVKILSGQMELSGETLAAQGDETTILVLAGQLILTSPVLELKCQLIVAGQIVAPRVSEPIIGSRLLYCAGQIVYYKGHSPRALVGDNIITADYLEMASEPLTLFLVGHTQFTSDITVDLLKRSIHDLILVGDVQAPRRLHGALQYLASTKVGNLIDSDETRETIAAK